MPYIARKRVFSDQNRVQSAKELSSWRRGKGVGGVLKFQRESCSYCTAAPSLPEPKYESLVTGSVIFQTNMSKLSDGAPAHTHTREGEL